MLCAPGRSRGVSQSAAGSRRLDEVNKPSVASRAPDPCDLNVSARAAELLFPLVSRTLASWMNETKTPEKLVFWKEKIGYAVGDTASCLFWQTLHSKCETFMIE